MLPKLNEEQSKKFNDWYLLQEKLTAKKQNQDHAYYGAIGGELTWHLTPTGIGTVVKVEHAGTKDILDLTDYDMW